MTQPTDRPAQPRHTVDTITSDALDALYEQLDAAQQTELARQLATCDKAFASATLRAARAEARAERAEATLTAVRAIADRWAESDVEVLRRAALVLAKEALDQHGQTTV